MKLIKVSFLILLNFGVQIINAGDDSLRDYNDSTVTDQSVLFEKFVDTGSVASKSNDKEKPRNDIQPPKLTPITPDTQGAGAIEITVYPKKTEVFINTEKIGFGNQYLKDLRSGLYKISLHYDKKRTSEYILVHSGELVHRDFVLSRKKRFIIEPSFSSFWVESNRSIGPALDLGLQNENNYYGINYFWDLIHDNTMTIGGSFLYYRDFNFEENFSICPGVCAGYWIYNRCDDDYGYDEYSEEHFFGGLLAKAKLGFKNIFLTFTYTFLIGTSTGHGLQFGFQFMI